MKFYFKKSIIISLKIETKGVILNTIRSKLKTLSELKEFIANGDIVADIVYEKENKIVISVKQYQNFELLKFERKIIQSCSDFNSKLSIHSNIRTEIDEMINVKGLVNEYLMFFDFTKNKLNVSYGTFERSLWLKDIPYVESEINNQAKKEEVSSALNILKRFKNKINKNYPDFFESEYLKIDNNLIIDKINNAKTEMEKTKRNKKLQYLMKFSNDTKAIYDTFTYLSSQFDLNNSNNLWIVLLRKYWNQQIRYTNAKERSEYFKQAEKYFSEHEDYKKQFQGLKADRIKQKVEEF